MTSHEYANNLQRFAAFLLSKPEFLTDDSRHIESLWYWGNKEAFLGAVKVLGAGRKDYSDKDFMKFYPDHTPEGVEFYLAINRSAVCRKVQEEKWECEPLLSQEEEAAIGG